MAESFRMNTSGDKSYREDVLEETAERFGENTKSGGVMAACDFSAQMERALQRAVEHPDMTEDLAEVLSTTHYELVYKIERGLETPEVFNR